MNTSIELPTYRATIEEETVLSPRLNSFNWITSQKTRDGKKKLPILREIQKKNDKLQNYQNLTALTIIQAQKKLKDSNFSIEIQKGNLSITMIELPNRTTAQKKHEKINMLLETGLWTKWRRTSGRIKEAPEETKLGPPDIGVDGGGGGEELMFF